jgi:hypothetical protein
MRINADETLIIIMEGVMEPTPMIQHAHALLVWQKQTASQSEIIKASFPLGFCFVGRGSRECYCAAMNPPLGRSF